MSMIGDAFATLRRLMVMDGDLQRMKDALDRSGQRLDDHNDRLVRIEALIEFSGYGRRPGTPRLPR